jgi:hypothetical protein
VVDHERVELGYDYCLKDECQQRCMKRVRLAAVAVNKAADYYMSADEVSGPAVARSTTSIDGDDNPPAPARSEGPKTAPKKRAKSTLEQLQEREALLDAALSQSFERFRNGEVTAADMDKERDRLVRAFNQRVMSENIRYRSMLRSRPSGGRDSSS